MGIDWAFAFMRAVRAAAWSFAGNLGAQPVVEKVTDFKRSGISIMLALWAALIAGLIAFAVNVAEEKSGRK